ncbi:MAG: hypothetical protein ABSE81_02525 [Candidatus Omnitrophota bacterium]|jgi:DNA-binding transcriptional MerR regulator
MLIDKEELAKELKISPAMVDYYRRKGIIPALVIGRNHRYDLAEVLSKMKKDGKQ